MSESESIDTPGDLKLITDNVKRRKLFTISIRGNVNVNANYPVSLDSITGWIFWLHGLGISLSLVGMITAYWYYDSEIWLGLWNVCKPENFPLGYGYLLIVRILFMCAFFFYFLAFFTVILYTFVPIEACEPNSVAAACSGLCFITSGAILTGVSFYGFMIQHYLGFSYAAAVFSGFFAMLGGVFGICVRSS